MKRVIKNNNKIIIGILIGVVLSVTTVNAVDAYIESNKVAYDNSKSNGSFKNVQESIDELYEKSGMHKEKWVDDTLNGADPVLKDPLIPVTIDNDGNVYYTNLNSEWYNYSERRWANAVILIDNPSNTNYGVGDKIEEDDIESYFVWIPRYQYQVWDLGKYTKAYTLGEITDKKDDVESSFWKVAGSNAKLVNIKFGDVSRAPKMTEPTTTDVYYTHPAFTLGDKNLNGIWVGKFETGYKDANSKETAQHNEIASDKIIIKPNVYSWRDITIKNMFMSAYEYKKGSSNHNETLNPHMMKNTEWGATVYLSHSEYGIGTEISLNNNEDFKTGYSATANADQRKYFGTPGSTSQNDLTQPFNTTVGYFASTTGNITGIYDMSGGAWEFLASCIENAPGDSAFTSDELNKYMNLGYIDRYASNSNLESFNNRILGDATGELGPFYHYIEGNGVPYSHNSWYGDYAFFPSSDFPWFGRGGNYRDGVSSGQFYFHDSNGNMQNDGSFRLTLSLST